MYECAIQREIQVGVNLITMHIQMHMYTPHTQKHTWDERLSALQAKALLQRVFVLQQFLEPVDKQAKIKNSNRIHAALNDS